MESGGVCVSCGADVEPDMAECPDCGEAVEVVAKPEEDEKEEEAE